MNKAIKHPQTILAMDYRAFINEYLMGKNSIEVLNSHHVNKPFSGTQLLAIDWEKYLEMAQHHLMLAQRNRLENNAMFRQLLPYVVVTRFNTETGVEEVLSYKRLSGGGEAKLHDRRSVGFGGHIDLADVETLLYPADPNLHPDEEQALVSSSIIDLEKTITQSCYRELNEEMRFFSKDQDGRRVELSVYQAVDLQPLQILIADTSTSVGQVHLGLVFKASVEPSVEIESGEDDAIELQPFKPLAELLEDLTPYEEWSAALLANTELSGKPIVLL